MTKWDADILKARKIKNLQNIPRQDFKARRGWCTRMMWRKSLCLHPRTSLYNKLPSNFQGKIGGISASHKTLQSK
ncbi:hypothetical protein PR048_004530 [Dryococelus australis]|uniref:Ribosomal protein S14 n=1 Tax=Dryococelus australis TaxID=614101 RepID=A0ABQ9I5Q5_9NEOP|nr:hypothetical protein PR048_004530 [Dryococelus australis]